MKQGTCVYCSGRRNVPWIFIWYTSLLVLLLAYMKGNANLCRAIVRAGARLGVNNNQGINIFNYQVATKQLLFRLLGIRSMRLTFTVELKPNVCWLTPQRLVYLECVHFHAFGYSKVIMLQIRFFFIILSDEDMLSKEPPWCDGSNCYECAAKFGVTTRKHHWYVLGMSF